MYRVYGTKVGKYARKRGRGAAETEKGQKKQQLHVMQLATCLALFLTVFVSKGVFPEQVGTAGARLMEVIRTNADFRGAFTRLGHVLTQQDSAVLEELGSFCVAVFAPEREQAAQTVQTLPPVPEYVDAVPVLSGVAHQDELTARFLGLEELPEQLRIPVQTRQEEPVAEQVQQPLSVGDVVQAVSYDGEPLPEHYTMQWLYLGDMETVTPVLGTISSGFGYRPHPTIKRYAPHGGVDIAAGTGTVVAAFADGTVEYIGENDDFGLYLQIVHEGGVKTFYAHCSKLCVKKGQQVSVGEKVAEVGSTGQSTGPHLHFEIKLDGRRLNPEYYIQTGGTV